MQSKKKCKKEPRLKTLAHEFALPWATNIGEIHKSIKTAEYYQSITKSEADNKQDLKDKKHLYGLSNFWGNVKNILIKYKKSRKYQWKYQF